MRFVCLFVILGFISACSNSITPDLPEIEIRDVAVFFKLPEEAHVRVWVENSYGTTVNVLVDEIKPSGSYTFPFNFIHEDGSPLPQGLYNFHIKAAEKYSIQTVIYDARPNVSTKNP